MSISGLITQMRGTVASGREADCAGRNAANTGKHRLTRFTELLSTGIFNFNKTTEQLCFTSEEQISSIAQACGMQLEILPNDRYTSNTIYIFQKNKPEHE